MTKSDTLQCQNEASRNGFSWDVKYLEAEAWLGLFRWGPLVAFGFILLNFRLHTLKNNLRELLWAPLFLIVQFPVAVYCIIDCSWNFQFPLTIGAATAKELQASLKMRDGHLELSWG